MALFKTKATEEVKPDCPAKTTCLNRIEIDQDSLSQSTDLPTASKFLISNTILIACWFCLIWLFTPNHQSFSHVGTGLPGLNQYLAWINLSCSMSLAQGNNAVWPVRLEPAACRSLVKHSTTEPLRSQGRCSKPKQLRKSHTSLPSYDNLLDH